MKSFSDYFNTNNGERVNINTHVNNLVENDSASSKLYYELHDEYDNDYNLLIKACNQASKYNERNDSIEKIITKQLRYVHCRRVADEIYGPNGKYPDNDKYKIWNKKADELFNKNLNLNFENALNYHKSYIKIIEDAAKKLNVKI